MSGENTSFIEVDGVKLHTKTWEATTATEKAQVVLVHGYADHMDTYKDMVTELNDNGYKVVGFDQRGWGTTCSGKKDYGVTNEFHVFNDLDKVLEKVLDKDDDSKKTFLLGHSMGGGIVLNYGCKGTLRNNIDGYIALAPLVEANTSRGFMKVLLPFVAKVMPKMKQSVGISFDLLSHDADVVKEIKNDPSRKDSATVESINDMVGRGKRLNNSVFVGKFADNKPVLVCHGTNDKICDPGAAKKFIKMNKNTNRTMLEYADAYHELHTEIQEHKAKFLNDLVLWLNKQNGLDTDGKTFQASYQITPENANAKSSKSQESGEETTAGAAGVGAAAPTQASETKQDGDEAKEQEEAKETKENELDTNNLPTTLDPNASSSSSKPVDLERDVSLPKEVSEPAREEPAKAEEAAASTAAAAPIGAAPAVGAFAVEAKKEEPKKEEPKKEEPKVEAKKEEPKAEEPKKEEPKVESKKEAPEQTKEVASEPVTKPVEQESKPNETTAGSSTVTEPPAADVAEETAQKESQPPATVPGAASATKADEPEPVQSTKDSVMEKKEQLVEKAGETKQELAQKVEEVKDKVTGTSTATESEASAAPKEAEKEVDSTEKAEDNEAADGEGDDDGDGETETKEDATVAAKQSTQSLKTGGGNKKKKNNKKKGKKK